MRLALGVEYDGSGFSGWQRLSAAGTQAVDGSLQTALENALSRVADARIRYTGKGEIARASKQGWLQRFFSKISPF